MTSSLKNDCPFNDTVLSFKRRTSRLSACSALLSAGLTISLATSAVAASVDKMLDATPLVLKDGRIAEVSVHTIPFPDDAVAPSSKTRSRLDSFTQSIATDCFLTAQVIGHVDKSEIGGRETADIHRLARARADTIQSSLIGNGLPAASIASVWDWRFMVQQARVTLWVFRLTAGEDCEDAPLERQAADQVAANATAITPTLPPAGLGASEPAVATVPEKEASPAEQLVIPAARPKIQEPQTPVRVQPPIHKNKPQNNVVDANHTQVASLGAAHSDDEKGSVQLVDKGALEIVFATNSSFFPQGTGDQLRAFMKTLDKNQRYVLRVQTSMDTHAGVDGASSADEAQRYNAWLAERRFKRVEAWLLKNSDGRQLTLEPTLVEGDGSRRVLVEPTPLS